MEFDEYRKRGKEMVDYIADYLENIRDRPVFPNVKPGYMRNLLPESAPIDGEEWTNIFADVERVIMPGMTHWQSPHMHAYFPALNSFPSLLGDMLADAINCIGFTWASAPACTELETIVMNWLGKMIGLPDEFLHSSSISKGGGVIQTTASEATLVCLLAGRTQAIRRFHEHTPGLQDSEINARLVAYCSDQAHSSVEKAALIGLVRMRYIESDDDLGLRGPALQEAIENDIKLGLIPFWVCATLGTTGACSFDNLDEVGIVCTKYNLWLHVDAAYAGSAFICPEYRRWLKGIEKADSIAFNPSKWLMVHFDCTALWVKNSGALHRTFNVEPLYLQHENSGLAIDYMHWQIPLSKRFRALKLWFVIRSYGIKGLQKHIREGVRLAQKFEALVLADHRFEIPAARHLGMVVFRIKGDNDLTERLLKRLNHRGNLHCVPASLKGKYVIRFTITSTKTTNDDIIKDWTEIRSVTTELLQELNIKISDRAKVALKDTREKNEAFGSSLLLANSPMSPKIVNGSFAAVFDADEFLAKAYAGIRIASQNSPAMRRRVRGILMSGKQFSLDSRMDLVFHGMETNSLGHEENGGVGGGDGRNKCSDRDRLSIKEDGEENISWEAYEPSESSSSSKMSSGLEMNFLLPTLPPSSDEQRQRSHSMDAVVPVQNKLKSSKTSLKFISEPNNVNAKLDDNHRSLLNMCYEDILPNNQNSSFTNVEDEKRIESFDCQNVTRRATKRFVSDPLFSTYINSIFPEKRQSDPHIRYAFTNKGFDISVAAERRKYLSQNDVRKNAMPNIAEYCFEDHVDWRKLKPKYESPMSSLSSVALPKFKVRVSDEWGQRIENSFDSGGSDFNQSFESFDNFFENNFKNSNDSFYDAFNDSSNFAIATTGDGADQPEPICCEKVKRCLKCGHKVIKMQFSTSFN